MWVGSCGGFTAETQRTQRKRYESTISSEVRNLVFPKSPKQNVIPNEVRKPVFFHRRDAEDAEETLRFYYFERSEKSCIS